MARMLPPAEDPLAAVAHEFRLRGRHIKGLVTTLLSTDVEWDAEVRSAILAEIELETDRLAGLVDGLLAAGSPDDRADP
jgi:signal transduction histidine kinase